MEEDRELSSGAEKVENIAGRTPEERERLAADARVEAARERERAALAQAQAQEEEKRLKEREKNERLAEAAHRRESREQERIARAEERERAREERAKERRRREGGRGVGGWIAAVVTLGVACLTLASVVAAGAMRMNDLEARLDNAAREAVYEMAEASEAMDASLSKLRVSEGRSEQRRLLTEVAVQSALLESGRRRARSSPAVSTAREPTRGCCLGG